MEPFMDGIPAEFREPELRYRMFADFAYDWEYWEGPNGTLRYVSPSCERISGYMAESFMRDPALLEALILPEDREVWLSHRHTAQAMPGEVRFRIRHRDGETRWIEHVCQPLTDEMGTFQGYRASNRDITERVRFWDELDRSHRWTEQVASERTAELADVNAALMEEIAERKRAEEALRRSEERYALAQRAANVGSWDWDIESGGLYWSEQIAPMFGLSPDAFEATYEAFLSCIHPEDRRRVIDAVDACVERGEEYAIDHRIVWPDGTVRWVSETGNVMRDGAGNAIRMLGVVRDVTDRKQAEMALRESEEKFRNVAEQSPNMIFINRWGRVLYANRRCEEITGYTVEEMCSSGFDFMRLVAPECVDLVQANFARHLLGEDLAPYEHTLITKHGSRLEVLVAPTVIQYQGQSAVLGTVTDITRRKHAEETLRNSEQFLQSALDALSTHIAILDTTGEIIAVNASWCTFADENGLAWEGYGVGRNYLAVLEAASGESKADAEAAAKGIRDLFEGRRDRFFLEYPCHSSRQQCWFMMRATRFQRGESARVVVSHEDMTERRLAENARRVQAHKLEERVKELNCLYGISNLVEQPGISLDEILKGTVELVLQAWRYPEFSSARVILGGEQFCTPGFRETPWVLSRAIAIDGEPVGSIEVRYLEEVPPSDIGPFMREEADLLHAIAQRLGRIVERVRVAEDLQEAKEAADAARREEEERRSEAERRGQIAESLAGVLAGLNSNKPLDQVLDLIAVQARQLLETRAVGIYSLEDEAGTLSIQAAQGLLIAYVAGTNIPIGQGALRLAMVSRQPVLVPDVASALGGDGDLVVDPQRLERVGYWASVYRALLAVPIRIHDQVYGGMVLYYGQPRSFTEEDLELAALFCEQAALAVENARLREEVKLAAATAERGRLARELHDAVTQTLFSASLIAEALPRVWDQRPEEGRRGLEELRQLTRGASAEMRTLLLELRPKALTEKPLGELLRHLTEAMTSRTRVPIALSVEGDSALPSSQQIAFYRIAQEALNNVAKHARASRVSVDLRCGSSEVDLHILDDGRGFDPEDVQPDHFGMGTMRERAKDIGAVLDVKSHPGQGTQVQVTWYHWRG
jgi:PAS domain S-box-containing protein